MRDTDASEVDVKKRAKALASALLPHHAGIEAMLFGRMVTGDALRRIDGILSTSPAIATEPVPTVQDFFIARDQLVDVGTAHMGTKPLSTGVFLQTTVIDEGRMAMIGDAVAPEDLVAWVVRAVAYAPTKLSRAGSAPLPPAAEVWVIRGNIPCAVEVGGGDLPATRDRVEEELEQRARLYGQMYMHRLSDGGLDALVDAVREDRAG